MNIQSIKKVLDLDLEKMPVKNSECQGIARKNLGKRSKIAKCSFRKPWIRPGLPKKKLLKCIVLIGRARPATFKREVSRSNNSAILIWETDSYSPIIDFTLKFRQVPAPDDAEWVTLVVPADGQNPGPIHSKSYRLSGLQVCLKCTLIQS